MNGRWLAALAVLLVWIVLSPPRAVAATVPMFIAHDAGVGPTATTWIETRPSLRPERGNAREYVYDDATHGYDASPTIPGIPGAGAVHPYNGARNLADGREVGERVIHDAADVTIAAEGVGAAAGPAARAESALSGSLLRQQLAAQEIAGAQMPSEIASYSRHALNQAISRDGVGVSARAIGDAFRNPLQIMGEAGGKFHFIGQNATVVVNAQGNIVTLWAESSAGWRIVP